MPPVAPVVVTAYRSVESAKAGNIATPAPSTCTWCTTGAAATAGSGTRTAAMDTHTSSTATKRLISAPYAERSSAVRVFTNVTTG